MNAIIQYLIEKMKTKKEHWEKNDEHSFIIGLGVGAMFMVAFLMLANGS